MLYDHQIFSSQRYGGISRYFYELIYSKYSRNRQSILPLIFSNNYYINNSPHKNSINFLFNAKFRGIGRVIGAINQANSIYNIKKGGFDLFHPTYYDQHFLNYIEDKPFVLTVYDMIHERFKHEFSSRDRTSDNKKKLCESADKIIAISQSTKDDLTELLGIDPSKIDVVYLGNSLSSKNSTYLTPGLPDKYILFVGGRLGYKNFNTFVLAISEILKYDLSLSVLCIGGGGFRRDEVELFDSLSVTNRIFQIDAPENILCTVYENAELFVFPSLYEGFGIPILESFACNCPLVCSNTSSFPEVAGRSAMYFDPYCKDSICSAIRSVLNDDELRRELVASGKERVESFSWKKMALETQEIYEELLR